jgi:hypothetical protein
MRSILEDVMQSTVARFVLRLWVDLPGASDVQIE